VAFPAGLDLTGGRTAITVRDVAIIALLKPFDRAVPAPQSDGDVIAGATADGGIVVAAEPKAHTSGDGGIGERQCDGKIRPAFAEEGGLWMHREPFPIQERFLIDAAEERNASVEIFAVGDSDILTDDFGARERGDLLHTPAIGGAFTDPASLDAAGFGAAVTIHLVAIVTRFTFFDADVAADRWWLRKGDGFAAYGGIAAEVGAADAEPHALAGGGHREQRKVGERICDVHSQVLAEERLGVEPGGAGTQAGAQFLGEWVAVRDDNVLAADRNRREYGGLLDLAGARTAIGVQRTAIVACLALIEDMVAALRALVALPCAGSGTAGAARL